MRIRRGKVRVSRRFTASRCGFTRIDATALEGDVARGVDAAITPSRRAMGVDPVGGWHRRKRYNLLENVFWQIGSSIGFGRHAQQDVGHEGSPNRPSRVLGRLRWRMAGVRTSAVSAVRGNF